MKIAFLILTHRDLVQLKRLIRALDYPQFDIFVHLDTKSPLGASMLEGLTRHSRLTVLSQRYSVHWGDISMVDAMLALYRQALEAGDYMRFVLLSGEDYPVAGSEDILKQLSEERELICGCVIPRQKWSHVRGYWFWRIKNRRLFHGTRKILRNLKIRKKPYLQIGSQRWEIYRSSQWTALTRECVAYILQMVEENPSIRRYFKYAYAPDELLIATIIYNTPKYATKAQPTATDFADKAVLHYLRYDVKQGSTVAVFDERDFEDIISSHKLFVRKLSAEKSEKLVRMLDAARLR